jgi:hypothetical protein
MTLGTTPALALALAVFAVSATPVSAADAPGYPQLVATALEQGCLDPQRLATAIQDRLHPTGSDARLSKMSVAPTAGGNDLVVQMRVDYQGGLGADRFVELAWRFNRYGGDTVTVIKDNGIAGVDSGNVKKLTASFAGVRASALELCVTRIERDLAGGSKTGAAAAVESASEKMSEKVLTQVATQFSAYAAARNLAKMRSIAEAPFAVYGVSGDDDKMNRECALEGGGLTAKTSKDIDAVLACVSGRIPKLPLQEGWTVESISDLKRDPAFVDYKAAVAKMPKNTSAVVTAEWGDCRHAIALIIGSDSGEAYVRGVLAGSNCPTELE